MGIALIGGLIAGASSAIVTGVFSWAAFAIAAGMSLVTRALTPKPDLGTKMSGRTVMTREAAHSRKIVYGRARIGGNVVFLESSGSDNKFLYLVTAIAGHEIDAYEEVWFNDKKIWDGTNYLNNYGSYVSITFYKGDQTAADSGLVAASSKWTTDHKLLGTAYMVVKLTYDQEKFAQGLPNISTVIRGKKVFNPVHSSPVWSQNPALCLYDYLRDTTYGLGESSDNILYSSVSAALGVCNETVTLANGSTQVRYTIDGVIDTADSLKSNIELMVGSMAGRLIYSSGKFEIHAGRYVAPSFTVDESHVVGEITVQTKQTRRNGYNAVKGVFLSEQDNYVLADYPAQLSKTTAGDFVSGQTYKILTVGTTNFTAIGASANTVGINFTATGAGSGSGTASLFLAEDDEQIFLDMPLPLTVNNVRAQRLAKMALLRSRQQETITLSCNLSALKFTIGDNIYVTNARLGYNQKIFEVVGYSVGFASDGKITVNVEAIETAASIWDWTSTDEEVFLGGGEVAIYDGTTTARPASISVTGDSYLAEDGTFNTAFNVAWPNSDDAFVDHYVVEWRLTGSGSSYFSQATKVAPLQINNVQNGQNYDIRVKAVNGIGVESATRDATSQAAVDNTGPDAPSSVSATGVFSQINLNWINPTQKDLSHVDVYRSNTNSGTYALIGNTDGTTFQDGNLGNAVTKFYKLKAVDFTGNASVFSSIVNATTTQIPSGSIADNAIGTAQIADDAITIDQIADDAVSTAQIVDNAVTNAIIATDAVNQGSIAANAVTATEIATDAVTANKILAGSITAGKIAADAVTAAKISVDDLSAINADLGSITAGSIDGVTVKIGSGESVFKADTNGIYLGNETFANAEFRVSPAGAVTATSATVSGAITATSGSIADGVTIGGTAASTVKSGALSGASALQDADTGVDLGLTGGSISGITISATKLHEGTGTFNNANTGFYLDNTGQFSLKDKLSFNGTTLAIDGNITANDLNVTNATVTGSFVANNLPNLQNMNGAITGGQLNDNAKFASFFRFTRTSGTSVAAPSDSDFETEFGRAPLENDQLVVTNTAPTPDTQAAYLRNASSAWVSVSDFIAGNLIVDGSIGANQISANAITAQKIDVTNLAAINADLGTITAGSIDGVTIKIGSGESVFKADTNGIYLGNETFGNAEFRVTPAGALVATSANISGAVTATSLNVTNATVTGSFVANNLPNMQNLNGVIAASQINAGTITVNKLSGDVTEMFPYSLDPSSNIQVLGSLTTLADISIPAPELALNKRNFCSLDLTFFTSVGVGIDIAHRLWSIRVRRKSKGANGVNLGNVVAKSSFTNYRETIQVSGNKLSLLDQSGAVDQNADGSNDPSSVKSIFYDVASDRTFIDTSNSVSAFSVGDTVYYSMDRFTSAGTYTDVGQTTLMSPVLAPNSLGSAGYHSISVNRTLGPTTTATEFRLTAQLNFNVTGIGVQFSGVEGIIGSLV